MINEISAQENVDMENGVLGAILLSERHLELIEHDLRPELFTHPANKVICQAIKELYIENRGKGIDLLTVSQKVKALGQLEMVGGFYYISTLTSKVAGDHNLEIHLRLLQQMFLVRNVTKICQLGQYKCNEHNADGFEIVTDIIQQLQKAEGEITVNKSFETIQSVAQEFMQDMMDKQAGIFPPSLKSGLIHFDELGGFFNTDLIIIAARPGMGKTALMVRFIRNIIIEQKQAAGCFTLEMSNKQLLTRIASAECEIDSELLRTGKVEHYHMNQLMEAIKKWRESKFIMEDKAAIDIDELCFKARKMKRDHDIKILMIDYLQLITSRLHKGDKQKTVSYVSNRLKQLAKDLDIPVIALAQLSRKVEDRKPDERMPILSDLRESGEIEQDADQIFFIFRPEYYDLKTFMLNGQETDMKGRAIVKCAKNRHGPLMIALFKFIGRYTDFRNDQEQLSLPIPEEPVAAPRDYSQPSKKDDLPF